jgi:23S rRNA pseudouridine1911/1915/1917 synthase
MSATDSEDGELLTAEINEKLAGQRVDKALASLLPELSRARIQALMADGALTKDGAPVDDGAMKVRAGMVFELLVPPPVAAIPQPQDLPLTVLYEDAHLIVVDKPAGMAAHPAPGTPDGTLVNALLFRCGDSLSGVGGVVRPGIVHRLDKDTSGVMVAAKTDAAHRGLSALFEKHDIERAYVAFVRGAPRPESGKIENRIGRSMHDRQKMAVLKGSGREAVTHYEVEWIYGGTYDKPLAARVICRLETGRTHQIRVHMASKGAPVLGDQIYGSGPPAAPVREAIAAAGLGRQALHAGVLGFVHPITGEALKFRSPLPPDMAALQEGLEAL